MTPGALMKTIYDMIPPDGVYERDLLHKLVNRYSQRSIEDTLAYLMERKFIKRAGDKSRPIFVRMEPRRVVYAGIKALHDGAEQVLLTMHSNFEEKRP